MHSSALWNLSFRKIFKTVVVDDSFKGSKKFWRQQKMYVHFQKVCKLITAVKKSQAVTPLLIIFTAAYDRNNYFEHSTRTLDFGMWQRRQFWLCEKCWHKINLRLTRVYLQLFSTFIGRKRVVGYTSLLRSISSRYVYFIFVSLFVATIMNYFKFCQ